MIPNKRSSTLSMAANAVTQSVALPGGGGNQLTIFNRGPQDAFFELSATANTPATVPSASTAGSFPVFANLPAVTVQLAATDAYFSAVSAGNSALHFSRSKLA